MRFHEFGKQNEKTVMLIHGMASTWKMSFLQVIPELSKRYHLILTVLDGYDRKEESEFISLKEEAYKIEKFISDNFDGRLYGAYGCSLGSNILYQLLVNQKIEIKKAVLDGALPTNFGIFSGIYIKLMTALGVKMVSGNPKLMLNLFGRRYKDALDKSICLDALKRSVRNGFECSFRYRHPVTFIGCDTELENWRGSLEPNQRFARKRVFKLFPGMKLKVFKGYGHGGLLHHPDILAQELSRVFG